MTDLRDLILAHAGRVAVVMGGGPSLPAQVKGLPDDCLWLSANEHGAKLRRCDYIVCIDDIADKVKPCGVPIISAQPWADVRLMERPAYPYTGMYACWVAWLLGCRLVLLGGMDLYAGPTYWHDGEAHSTAKARPYSGHLEQWRRVRLPVPIRALGGPLIDVFGRYDPNEAVPYVPADLQVLRSAASGTVVQFRKDWTLKSVFYPAHTVAEIPRLYAQDLLARRVVKLWTEA